MKNKYNPQLVKDLIAWTKENTHVEYEKYSQSHKAYKFIEQILFIIMILSGILFLILAYDFDYNNHAWFGTKVWDLLLKVSLHGIMDPGFLIFILWFIWGRYTSRTVLHRVPNKDAITFKEWKKTKKAT